VLRDCLATGARIGFTLSPVGGSFRLVPATGNGLLDFPAGLPGPAAISLPGSVRAQL